MTTQELDQLRGLNTELTILLLDIVAMRLDLRETR